MGGGLVIIKFCKKKKKVKVVKKTRWGSFLLKISSVLASPFGQIKPIATSTFSFHCFWTRIEVFKYLWINGVLKQSEIQYIYLVYIFLFGLLFCESFSFIVLTVQA